MKKKQGQEPAPKPTTFHAVEFQTYYGSVVFAALDAYEKDLSKRLIPSYWREEGRCDGIAGTYLGWIVFYSDEPFEQDDLDKVDQFFRGVAEATRIMEKPDD